MKNNKVENGSKITSKTLKKEDVKLISPMKNVFNIIKTILNTIVIVFVICFVLIVCMQRFSNNRLSFFNYRLFTVVSGSMEPSYEIGDVLIAKEKEASKIEIGDTISYLGSIGQFSDIVITHRVIDIDVKDGKYYFHTKGDANLIEDPLVVSEDKLYGVVIHKAALLSNVYRLVATQTGMFIFVVIPILYIIGSEFVGFLLEKEEARRNKSK